MLSRIEKFQSLFSLKWLFHHLVDGPEDPFSVQSDSVNSLNLFNKKKNATTLNECSNFFAEQRQLFVITLLG